MATINDLPVELLPFIFKYLGIKDLTRARSVCKVWRYLCDKQKIMELIMVSCEHLIPKYQWYHTQKKTEQDNVIVMDVLNADEDVFKRKLLKLEIRSELKRLRIRGGIGNLTLFNHLYVFSKLDQLECDINYGSYHSLVISHSNIRILVINKYPYHEQVQINAEKLKVLKFQSYFGYLDITWPESLIKLEAEITDNKNGGTDFDKLSSFKNLEVIHTTSDNTESIILTHLPKLKKYRFISFDSYRVICDYLDLKVLKSYLKDLIKVKKQLQRTDFKIYHDDTELITIEQTREFLNYYYSDCGKQSGILNSDSEIEEMEDDSMNDTD